MAGSSTGRADRACSLRAVFTSLSAARSDINGFTVLGPLGMPSATSTDLRASSVGETTGASPDALTGVGERPSSHGAAPIPGAYPCSTCSTGVAGNGDAR